MKKKILILTVIVIFVCITIASLITLTLMKNEYLEQIEKSLATECRMINTFIKESDEASFDFSRYAHIFSEDIGARVTFINYEGVVVGDSEIEKSQLSKVENHRHREEVKEALKGEIGKGIRNSSTVGIDYMYIALAFEKNDQVGITRIAFPLYELEKINDQILAIVLFAAIISLISAISLSILYSGKVTRPIRDLTEYARRITNGNYKDKVYIKTGDEIEVLGNTLNEMGERLNTTIEQLISNNSKLSSILFSMKEAMIAVDMDYHLIMINHAAKKRFLIDEEVLGEHLLKVIRNNQLYNVFEKILQEQYIGEQEIEYGEGEILKINISYIRSEKDHEKIGVLALIEDITQIKELENMRKEFVANVSHELKTPLTSISGFLETLQSGAAETPKIRNRFLDIISIETARLKRLIEDLLILSGIENGNAIHMDEEIEVVLAIDDVLKLLENETEKKKIKVVKRIPNDQFILKSGNTDRFKQMILNLIDNAVKYSHENGVIEIKAMKTNGKIIISIKDEGIGIPKEHLTRLFERFYRVDKARSKKVGGTGLGLAIVKHIVLLFNGSINVESKEGKGSTFTVTLPVEGD